MKKLILLSAFFLVIGLTLSTYGQALSGNYYIGAAGTGPGGTDPQYATLKAAIDDVKLKGVGGNIIYYITSNLTESTNIGFGVNTNSFSITIKPSADENRTVTFTQATDNTSSSGAIVIGLSDLSTWASLVITENIVIDGYADGYTTRRLTLQTDATSHTANTPIHMIGDVNNVTVKNCSLLVNQTTGTSSFGAITLRCGRWSSVDYLPDNIIIDNCYLNTKTPSGAGVFLSNTTSNGGATPVGRPTGILIKNNEIVVKHRAVSLNYSGTCTVDNNTIKVNQPGSGFASFGIGGTSAGLVNTYVTNNRIIQLATGNTGGGTNGIRGIQASAGGTWHIYNNFISGFSTPSTGTTEILGIRSGSSSNIYNNTIIIDNLSTTGSGTQPTSGIVTFTVSCDIRNNLIVTHEDDFANYCIYASSLPNLSDYNNFYRTGTINAKIGYFGGSWATLADWQTSTTKDAYSVSKSVTFVSASDLHLSGASIGDNDLAGTPIASVTTDIDGDARHALFPYMGADEIPGSLLRLVSPRPVPMTSSVSNADAFSANGLLGTNPTAFYVHWDATYLYLGWDGGRTNYSSDLYYAAIDTDPLGANGTANAIEGVSFVTGGPKPDYYVVYENNSSFYGATADLGNAFEIYGVNEGNWVWISRTDGNNNISSRVVFSDGPGEVRLRVPWATLNFVPGASAKLGIVMWNNNGSGNYLWGVVPVSVPTEGATPVTLTKFFLFPSTGNDVNPSTDKSESIFPVELSMFKARFVGKNVELNWTTATELNSNKFIVERKSSDVWVSLAEVNASGNSNSPKEYSFSDKNLADGKYSYRLKMIDNDGTFDYSPVVEVEVDVPNAFALSQNYPNPFNPVTQIQYQLPVNSQVKLMIYTITGELVTTLVDENQPAGNYTVPFDASALASGTYIYRLVAGDFVATKKMVVLK